MQFASFPFFSCLPLFVNQCLQYENVVGCAEVFSEACLPLGFDTVLKPCSSAHDAILCSSIIANILAITEPTVMPLWLLTSDLLPGLYTAVGSPTDRCSGKWPASIQLNSHSKLCFTTIFDHVSKNAIDARTFATLQPLYAQLMHLQSQSKYTWNNRSLRGRQGLGSHQSSTPLRILNGPMSRLQTVHSAQMGTHRCVES